MNIKEVSKEIYETNANNGFWDKDRNIGEMLMLIVSELSEALESHRKERQAINTPVHTLDDFDFTDDYDKSKFEEFVKDTFEDELADVAIRLFDLCEGLGIDLEWHIKQKLNYNKTRERLHGKKY